MIVSSQTDFYPVGQGLFCVGEAWVGSGDEPFRWVYDCGTASAQRLVRSAIRDLEVRIRSTQAPSSRPVIDLVCVSHFDIDHVSGLEELLSIFEVKVLMIPFAPLWMRMASCAAGLKTPTVRVMEFAIDPVGYILARRRWSVGRIVLVPPSSGGREQAERVRPDELIEPNAGLRMPTRAPADAEEAGAAVRSTGTSGSGSGQVVILREGGAIVVNERWEFLPFNDSEPLALATPAFVIAARDTSEAIKAAGNSTARRAEIAKLKALFDSTFGARGYDRNVISLMVYAGAIRWRGSLSYLASREFYLQPSALSAWEPPLIGYVFTGGVGVREVGHAYLFTGDAYLDSSMRVDELANYLGTDRVSDLSCLQVMHHGARDNWCERVAEVLSPSLSVFSSDPRRRRPGHPHREVWDGFELHGRRQVDDRIGLRVTTAQL